MIRASLAAACLLLLSHQAKADTITFTVPVSASWVEFPEGTTVAVPGFNVALGTLTGVADTLSGTGFETLSGYGPITGPFQAAITQQFAEIGPSGHQSFTAKPFSISAGPTSFSTGFAFDATFTDPPLNHSGQTIYDAYLLGFTAIDESNGLPIHGDSGLSYKATLTETFTYTPSAIAEPRSIALFATAALTLISLVKRRIRLPGA
jgi:hypothetical protein